MGGGNPALASLEFLSEVLTTVTQLGTPQEVTIEVNSESLREEHTLLFDKGVNRLSVGLQSLNREHLKTLGRRVDLESNYRAIELTNRWREAYNIEVNFDLITSIPNQTIEEAQDEISQLVRLASPHHISLYNLTLEEGSELAQMRNLPFKEEQEEATLLFALWEELEALGYHQYEISNFAKEERYQSLHNGRYWSLDDYLGLGSSAVSLISNVNYTNESNLTTYGNSEPFTTYLREELTQLEMMESHLMMGLRTSKGIDKREWFKRYAVELNTLFEKPIKALQNDERHLIVDRNENFSLTKEGFMLLDAIILYLANFCH